MERRRREGRGALAMRSVVGNGCSRRRSRDGGGRRGKVEASQLLARMLGWGSGAGGGGGERVVVGVGSVCWRRCVGGTGRCRAGSQCKAQGEQAVVQQRRRERL